MYVVSFTNKCHTNEQGLPRVYRVSGDNVAAILLRFTTLWTLVLFSTEQFEAKPNNCLPT
jgi:hypothetical protein